MSRRAQDNVVLVLIMLVFVAIIVMSLGYGPRARMVPLPVATFGLVLAAIQLVWQNVRPSNDLHVDVLELLTGRREEDVPQAGDAAGSGTVRARGGAQFRAEMRALGIVVGFVAAFVVFGALPTTFVFGAVYLGASRQYSWTKSVLAAVLFTAVIWLLFGEILTIPLDRSMLQPFVGRLIG